MLKSDLERLFRVEFFTIVFAIIVGVILLPFVPAILGLAVGAIVIVTVIGIGAFIIFKFPQLIIGAIIFVVGFVVVGLVTGFFQNLKYSREKKIKEKKEAIYTKSFNNLSLEEKEKLKRQRNYLDEKEVKKLIEKNKLSHVGPELNKAYLETKDKIKRAKEEKIKKEEEERQKKEEERQKEKQRILKVKEEKLLIINNVKKIQKEIEKSEKTLTEDEESKRRIVPDSDDKITFRYEEDFIRIFFYGRLPLLEIRLDVIETSSSYTVRMTNEYDNSATESFNLISKLNDYLVKRVGALWAEYKK
jgi:hypothetical protein